MVLYRIWPRRWPSWGQTALAACSFRCYLLVDKSLRGWAPSYIELLYHDIESVGHRTGIYFLRSQRMGRSEVRVCFMFVLFRWPVQPHGTLYLVTSAILVPLAFSSPDYEHIWLDFDTTDNLLSIYSSVPLSFSATRMRSLNTYRRWRSNKRNGLKSRLWDAKNSKLAVEMENIKMRK